MFRETLEFVNGGVMQKGSTRGRFQASALGRLLEPLMVKGRLKTLKRL
jgi:hypothetical protein